MVLQIEILLSQLRTSIKDVLLLFLQNILGLNVRMNTRLSGLVIVAQAHWQSHPNYLPIERITEWVNHG